MDWHTPISGRPQWEPETLGYTRMYLTRASGWLIGHLLLQTTKAAFIHTPLLSPSAKECAIVSLLPWKFETQRLCMSPGSKTSVNAHLASSLFLSPSTFLSLRFRNLGASLSILWFPLGSPHQHALYRQRKASFLPVFPSSTTSFSSPSFSPPLPISLHCLLQFISESFFQVDP